MIRLSEIAALAGVSPAAVSLVLHNKKGVGAQKRAEIEQLLRSNGYYPGEFTQARKDIRFVKLINDTNQISGNPSFVTAIMDAVEKECRSNGYNLTFTTTSDLPGIIDYVNSQSPDGVILLGTEMFDEDAGCLSRLSAPLVVLDNLLPLARCHCVSMDNYASIFEGVRHLKELGHTKIGFLRTPIAYSSNCEARLRSFREAVEFYELRYYPEYIYNLYPSMNGSYNVVSQLLKSGERFPSAIVANSDVTALGALKAFDELGVKVPQDISVIGFDDISFCEISNPPLTTVNVPCHDMGVWAVRLLCDYPNQPDGPYLKIQVGTTFTVRSSTGPAKRG